MRTCTPGYPRVSSGLQVGCPLFLCSKNEAVSRKNRFLFWRIDSGYNCEMGSSARLKNQRRVSMKTCWLTLKLIGNTYYKEKSDGSLNKDEKTYECHIFELQRNIWRQDSISQLINLRIQLWWSLKSSYLSPQFKYSFTMVMRHEFKPVWIFKTSPCDLFLKTVRATGLCDQSLHVNSSGD